MYTLGSSVCTLHVHCTHFLITHAHLFQLLRTSSSRMSAGLRFIYRVIRTSPGAGNGDQSLVSTRHLYSPIRRIKGVIFDMDGTLTIPVLNFLEMRTRLGLSRGVDILPTVLSMPAEERERAMKIIQEMEEEGLTVTDRVKSNTLLSFPQLLGSCSCSRVCWSYSIC